MTRQRLAAGIYGVAVLLAVGAFAGPPLLGRRDDAGADTLAEEGLRRIADGERALLTSEGKFAPFGPAASERVAVLPRVTLGPEFHDLSFDALPGPRSGLHIRVMSRVDAIREGRIAALFKTIQLVDHTRDVPDNGQ